MFALKRFVKSAQSFAEDYTIYLIGRKQNVPEDYTFTDMANDYAKLIRKEFQKPVIVMSNTLTQNDIPAELEGKVCISNLSPKEIMKSLNDKGWKRAYVDGGQIVQSFIRAGLIEDLIITLGAGDIGRVGREFLKRFLISS